MKISIFFVSEHFNLGYTFELLSGGEVYWYLSVIIIYTLILPLVGKIKFSYLFIFSIVLGLFVVLTVISSLICSALSVPETIVIYVPFVVIVASFILSFLIYNKVMKWAVKKWNLNEAFEKRN